MISLNMRSRVRAAYIRGLKTRAGNPLAGCRRELAVVVQ
jgi:hypothetical protein